MSVGSISSLASFSFVRQNLGLRVRLLVIKNIKKQANLSETHIKIFLLLLFTKYTPTVFSSITKM